MSGRKITVKGLIAQLKKFPKNAICDIYEGEVRAITIKERGEDGEDGQEGSIEFYADTHTPKTYTFTSTKEKQKLIPLWVEGYCITGSYSNAQFLGKFKAKNLKGAVKKYMATRTDFENQNIDLENLTEGGCRFFDNEKDARKSFG